jgi:hypothetical protein
MMDFAIDVCFGPKTQAEREVLTGVGVIKVKLQRCVTREPLDNVCRRKHNGTIKKQSTRGGGIRYQV